MNEEQMITSLKKIANCTLWILLFSVVITIGYQWRWVFFPPSSPQSTTSAKQLHRLNIHSLGTSLSDTTFNDDSHLFLTINLSTQHLVITKQRKYVINIEASTNSQQPIHWQSPSTQGLSISLEENNLILIVDDINFDQLPLTLRFYNDEVSIEKTIKLINSRQQTPPAPHAQDISLDEETVITSKLTGTITLDRLSFIESTSENITSYHFNPDYPQQHPLRFMQLNLRDTNDNIIARTYTDASGDYEFDISFDAYSADYYLEVVSQMKWNHSRGVNTFVQVINQGEAYPERTTYRRLYHSTSSIFRLLAGDNQQDVRLKTGWHATLRQFEPQHSAAQPFAILDTLTKGFLYLQANDIEQFTPQNTLTVHWSQDPDIVQDSTGYYDSTNNVIYISGSNALDTQQKKINTISEWNEHTILHEFGHFYLKKIVGRDDTQAGSHTAFGFGSLTLAFSEGLASSLAKTILKDWQEKRVNIEIDKKRFVTSAQAIVRDETRHVQRHLTNQRGEVYQRPNFDFSPFIESTISYFILSIIAPQSEYSARTRKLHHDIGMQGLHQALLSNVNSADLLTIYSLAQTLKQQHPAQQFAIDELGAQLDLNLNDEWGTQQAPLTSHIVGHNDELLPEIVQYPLYLPVHIGQRNAISFNGALQSLSAKRPGTLRYLVFTAPKDGRVIIDIPNVVDNDDNTHQFSFNIVEQGEIISGSRYSEKNELTYSAFIAQQDSIYIIRVFDELFSESVTLGGIKSEHTVTTNITLGYR